VHSAGEVHVAQQCGLKRCVVQDDLAQARATENLFVL
jgi:hypothetical protein